MSSELSAYKNFFDEFNRLAIKNSEKQFQEWQRFFDDYKLINQKLLKQKQPAISYDVANAENFFEDFSKLYNKTSMADFTAAFPYRFLSISGKCEDRLLCSTSVRYHSCLLPRHRTFRPSPRPWIKTPCIFPAE